MALRDVFDSAIKEISDVDRNIIDLYNKLQPHESIVASLPSFLGIMELAEYSGC